MCSSDLTADNGLTGLGEASLEWQEKAVQTLIHEWVEERVLGIDPADVESLGDALIRDQYQGGSTVLTAISSVEIAMWDLLGKACGQPVGRLLGGRYRSRVRPYASLLMREPGRMEGELLPVKAQGFRAFKIGWGPFGRVDRKMDEAIVRAAREAVGEDSMLMVDAGGSDADRKSTRLNSSHT